MYSMATRIALNQEGVLFQVKVIDCVTDSTIDTNSFQSQRIVFYKPDGTRFEEDAVINGEFIEFQQPSGEDSILDLIGSWQYSAEVTLQNTNVVETSQRFNFWVD